MLLLIDAGNTTIEFVFADPPAAVEGTSEWNRRWNLGRTFRLGSDPGRTADEYAVWCGDFLGLSGKNFDDIRAVAISCVVPRVLENLKRFVHGYLPERDVIIIKDTVTRYPIEIGIEAPGQLGADRIAGAVAGWGLFGGPIVIVDSGTATSWDVVSAAGVFLGGVLAPGVRLSAEALSKGTAVLPQVDWKRIDRVIGQNTLEAVRSGIFWGYTLMIEGIIEKITQELGEKPKVISTGGLGEDFFEAVPSISRAVPDLVLQGLAMIHVWHKSEVDRSSG